MSGARGILRRVALLLAPPLMISTAAWADQYRVLSSDVTADYGKWHSYPYQIEPMEATSDPSVYRVVINAATQMLKSAVGENFNARNIDVDPGPTLILLPRNSDARDWVQDNLSSMIRDNPRLSAKVLKQRAQKVSFRGGAVTVVGAGAAANVARKAIRYLIIDEADRIPGEVGGEGNSIVLARKRLATFGSNTKELILSSPTVEGSNIDTEYKASDRRMPWVPCPSCGAMQILEWGQVRWEEGKPETALYHCNACETGWDDAVRKEAIHGVKWVAEAPFAGIAGFWINELYSFPRKLSDIVRDYLTKPGQEFTNTSLALNHKEPGEAPQWEGLANRPRLYHEGIVPRGAVFLTAGADVQADRIEVEVVAWGPRRQSWSVLYEIYEGKTTELRGQPGKPSPWERLQALMAEVFPHQNGGELVISKLFVDARYETNTVYQWVRLQGLGRIEAVFGEQKGSLPVSAPSAVDITIGGRKITGGLKIRHVVGPFFKSELYADLKKESPTKEQLSDGWQMPDGYCWFPEGTNYGDEHFKQLCAEQQVPRRHKRTGRVTFEWQQMRARNEALDCRVYARGAAWACGIDRWREAKWEELAKQFGPQQSAFALEAPAGLAPAPRPVQAAPPPAEISPLAAVLAAVQASAKARPSFGREWMDA